MYIKKGLNKEEAFKTTTHLAIVAHPDDAEIMAPSGIVQCYKKSDSNFSCIVLTNGKNSARAGKYKDVNDEEMSKIRIQEQINAAVIGEYNFVLFPRFESSFVKSNNSKVEDYIFNVVKEVKPNTIYLHNPFDKHKTHVWSMRHSINAIRRMNLNQKPKEIYGMEVWRDLDWLCDEDKVAFKLYDDYNILERLITVHDSQIAGGKKYDKAIMGRRYANATFYKSHETDNSDMMSFGIDLRNLIYDDKLDYKKFINLYIDKFKRDVLNNIL